MRKENLLGKRFERLVVAGEAPPKGHRRYLNCKCECGKECAVSMSNLKSGAQKSCGCLREKHGGLKIPCYVNWRAMIARCYNGNQEIYQRYGGRGVRVCEFLRATPFNVVLVIGEKPSSKHTIDRFPIKDGHYACGACAECMRLGLLKNIRWASDAEQCRNRKSNILITIDGETKCLQDWAAAKGVNVHTAYKRYHRGLNPFNWHKSLKSTH